MELHDYVKIARHYWRSIIATVLLAVIAAATWTLLQSPIYSASSSLYIAVQSGDTAGELSQGASYTEQQLDSFVRVARTAAVLQPVIDDLSLEVTIDQLAAETSVTSPTGTSVIEVTVTNGDPAQAAVLASEITDSLIATIDELSPTTAGDLQLVQARVIDPAVVPQSPSSPRPVLNLTLGVLIGLILAAGQAVLRNLLDTRVRTANDIAELTEAPLLGTITRINTDQHEAWAAAESYRQLRTNVGFLGLGGERKRSMVITSATEGEGKTETACNLARMMARAGERVLLVDADLRRSKVADRLGIDGELGLSDVISGRIPLGDVLTPVGSDGLHVLPAGTVPPNPSELLGSEAFGKLLDWAEDAYDHVLFDAPPLLPVTDAVVLGGRCGGVMVVARHGMVKRAELASAVESLETGTTTVLGVVMNDVPRQALGRSGSSYYYGSTQPKIDARNEPAVEVTRPRRLASPNLEIRQPTR